MINGTPDEDVVATPARLIPLSIQAICPVCGEDSGADPVLTEDEYGELAARGEDRFATCEHCETLLDLGWKGWHVP